jgi:hypothetical protein
MPAQTKSLVVRLSMRLNGVIDLVLRSRLHWLLSRGLALITVTGRRTGRRYTIPVGYLETPDGVVVLVGDAPAKTWWRNYQQPGPIEMRLRGVVRCGRAVVLAPGSEPFRRTAEAAFRRARFIPRLFGIVVGPGGELTNENAARMAQRAAIVRITLD